MKNEQKEDQRGKAPKLSNAARASGYATAEEIAEMLKLSVQRVRQLRNEGAMITEDTPQGRRYHLVKSLHALCMYLLARQDKDAVKDRAAKADADYKERKAALMDIELKKRKGEVHEARHVMELLNGMIIEMKAAFLAIPARIAMSLLQCRNANETSEIVRNAICEVMEDLASHEYDPEKFRQLVDEDGDINALQDDEEEEEADTPQASDDDE